MSSKLIIDSGATSWKYAYLTSDVVLEGQLEGYNAYLHSDETFVRNVMKMKSDIDGEPDGIYFYGAGILGERQRKVELMLREIFPQVRVEARSDIMAVAHASSASEATWVGILGTGSNIALYEGEEITYPIPSMGYIFGDEGSGRDILKRLVVQYFRGGLTPATREIMASIIKQDYASFMESVYRDGQWPIYSAQWMSSLSQHWEHPEIKRIARESIGNFQSIMINAQAFRSAPLFLVGGVAEAYKVYICNLWKECATTTIQIAPSPLPGLIKYYQHEH